MKKKVIEKLKMELILIRRKKWIKLRYLPIEISQSESGTMVRVDIDLGASLACLEYDNVLEDIGWTKNIKEPFYETETIQWHELDELDYTETITK